MISISHFLRRLLYLFTLLNCFSNQSNKLVCFISLLIINQVVWAPAARSFLQGCIWRIPVRFSGGTTLGQCVYLYE